MKLIDLTQTFTDDMPVYPGDPASSLVQTATIDKNSYSDYMLSTLMHVGTHMDAPFHMIKDGQKMDEIDPEQFFGTGVVINVKGFPKIDVSILKDIDIKKGSIVLLYTGFGEKYKTESYYENCPELTEDFAQKMVEKGVKMVGMDMLGPDHDAPWATHKILLGADILILENLTNLDQLLDTKTFDIIALPAKLHSDAAPVRVLAQIQ